MSSREEGSRGEAAAIMLREGISGLPVVEDDEVVGIITKTDLIKGIQ